MKSNVKVSIFDNQDSVKLPAGTRMLIRRCCTAVIAEEGLTDSYEVSVTIVDDAQIHELNKKHRSIDRPTDVLSFPLGEGGKYDVNPETGACQLGDIVISIERAVAQANLYGHTLNREIGFLTVHSMLHLLGYDHEKGGMDLVRMREKEEAVLTKLGLPRSGSYYTDVN